MFTQEVAIVVDNFYPISYLFIKKSHKKKIKAKQKQATKQANKSKINKKKFFSRGREGVPS